jgi:hypothetical protein
MKNFIRGLSPIAAVALIACSPLVYGKLEDPSIKVTQATPNIPGAPQVALTVADLFPAFSFGIGEIPGFDETSKESSVVLNSATIAMTSTSSSASNFGGITSATLFVTATGQPDKAVAVYDSTHGSLSADKKTLALAPVDDSNLLQYFSAKAIGVKLSGSGTLPGPAPGPGPTVTGSWSADVTLDFHVIAQENVM